MTTAVLTIVGYLTFMRLFFCVAILVISSASCEVDCSLAEDAPSGCRFDPEVAQIQCRAAIPTFYFDKKRDRCVAYSYGGCNDTPYEPFSTLEECELCLCHD